MERGSESGKMNIDSSVDNLIMKLLCHEPELLAHRAYEDIDPFVWFVDLAPVFSQHYRAMMDTLAIEINMDIWIFP